MKRVGIFILVASCALPPLQATAESKSERQQARYQAAVSRMVERSRPAAAQPRPPSAMPSMQRPIQQPQQRPFRGDGIARSGRMLNPDASQSLRSRGYDAPRIDREVGRPSRVINTAAVNRPIEAPAVSSAAVNQRDANRADRIRDFVDRNREGRNRGQSNRGGRNRGASDITVPGANVETQTGAVTSPTTDQQEGRRHSGDHDHDGTHRHGGDRHREWHERHKDDPDFERKHRRWHNREWYRRNYNRFVLFGGGYYYWNRGYWYPAYGYHPTYSTYIYDAPIYSYNGLPPGQVLSMVQMQLQQRGYYNAAVDGTYGPRTRQALLNYQADHGLPMTGQIDQETLLSLGFE